MSNTKHIGYTASGKKIYELEITQEDCDEMNALKKRLGLDKAPDHQESKPYKTRYLFG